MRGHILGRLFVGADQRRVVLVFGKIDRQIILRSKPEHERADVFAVHAVIDEFAHHERIHALRRFEIHRTHQIGLTASK